jgi:hypothetical protein
MYIYIYIYPPAAAAARELGPRNPHPLPTGVCAPRVREHASFFFINQLISFFFLVHELIHAVRVGAVQNEQ